MLCMYPPLTNVFIRLAPFIWVCLNMWCTPMFMRKMTNNHEQPVDFDDWGIPYFRTNCYKPIGCNQIHQLASLPGTTDWLVVSKGFQYIVYLCFYHCRSMFISLIIPTTGGLISNDFPNFLEPRFRLMQPRHAEVNMPAMPTRFLSWNKSPRCSPPTCTCDGNWVAKGFSQCLRWVGVKLLGHWIYQEWHGIARSQFLTISMVGYCTS